MVRKSLQQGVTLIELMVVVGIFSIVSTILLFNYSDFSTNVSVRNLAQDIALSVRKAQSYATSVRNIPLNNGTFQTDAFKTYGAAFSIGDNRARPGLYDPTPKQFIIFADYTDSGAGSSTSDDRIYTAGQNCGAPADTDECLESLSINTADKVVAFCDDGATGSACTTNGPLYITFTRPIPDAHICLLKDGSTQCTTPAYVDIVVESVKGLQHKVTVWNTGQISVK